MKPALIAIALALATSFQPAEASIVGGIKRVGRIAVKSCKLPYYMGKGVVIGVTGGVLAFMWDISQE